VFAAVVIGVLFAVPAMADPFAVFVGYADNIRPSPFFPIPWQGDAGVEFHGAGPSFDAGAIRIDNNSGGVITVDSVVVDGFKNGASFSLWGSFTIANGDMAVLTQTVFPNFDTSDQGNLFVPDLSFVPKVHITIGGVTQDFADTGHVLDTGGSDALAQAGLNESFQWRPIGTFGGQAGVPEPSSIFLLGSVLAGFVVYRRRRSQTT